MDVLCERARVRRVVERTRNLGNSPSIRNGMRDGFTVWVVPRR